MAEINFPDDWTGGYFLGAARMHHTSGIHDACRIGMEQRLFHQLLYQNDRSTFLSELRRNVENAIHDDWGQSARGLIKNEQLRLGKNALTNRQNLLLTARERRRRIVLLGCQFREKW